MELSTSLPHYQVSRKLTIQKVWLIFDTRLTAFLSLSNKSLRIQLLSIHNLHPTLYEKNWLLYLVMNTQLHNICQSTQSSFTNSHANLVMVVSNDTVTHHAKQMGGYFLMAACHNNKHGWWNIHSNS
jgi:hypothetical protein